MSGMNPMKLMRLKSAIDRFKLNHPKFPLFINAVTKDGMKAGTIIDIKVTSPDGKTYDSNIKITESDLELIEELKSMTQS